MRMTTFFIVEQALTSTLSLAGWKRMAAHDYLHSTLVNDFPSLSNITAPSSSVRYTSEGIACSRAMTSADG